MSKIKDQKLINVIMKKVTFGGKKTVNIIKPYISIGHEEKIAVNEVLDTNFCQDFTDRGQKNFWWRENKTP